MTTTLEARTTGAAAPCVGPEDGFVRAFAFGAARATPHPPGSAPPGLHPWREFPGLGPHLAEELGRLGGFPGPQQPAQAKH